MCDQVDEEGVDAGCSVQFVIGSIIWTAAELWSVRTPILKSLIFILYNNYKLKLCIASYKCRL